MTELLVKLFVRESEKVRDPAVRERYGVLAGVVGIVLNVLLSAGKLLAGFAAGSVSIVGDALNNLTDAGGSVTTLIGFKLAGQKADDHHPFGHGRIEYLTGLVVAVIILLVGVELGRTSIGKIVHPDEVRFSALSTGILAVSIGVKLWMSGFHRKLARRIDSAAMRAAAADSLSDAVATTAVLAGAVFHRLTRINIDGWVGAAVALFILKAGWDAVKDTIDPLLGTPPDPELVRSIRATVLSHPQVVGMHDMVIHDYGPGRTLMSFHAEVPVDSDIMQAHDAIDHIEREIFKTYGIETSIHMDPIDTNDQERARISQQMTGLIQVIEPGLTLHDFRMTRGPLYTNLIFDVVVPYKCPLSDEELSQRIGRAARALDPSYRVVIQFDRSSLATEKRR